ncbi:histidine kinase [Nonomuraea sp. NPDC005983]|uniref:sensor histidine kinase n=1 Tax=Nonomuraea sp. NPDC005983 TaxID=3155595 RepID=UPI0033B30706
MDAIKRARRLTRGVLNSILVAMWICVVISTGLRLAQGQAHWVRVAPALIAAICFTWLYLRITNAILERRHATRDVVVAGALAVFAAAVGGADPIGWGFVVMVWLSIATVQVSRRAAVALTLGTFAVTVALSALSLFTTGTGMWPAGEADRGAVLVSVILIYAVMSAALPPSNRIWAWIWTLAVQAHEGREAHTRLALAEERLRFARDLHDLVGHQLSAIAVKTELAVRLSDTDGPAAKAEMVEVNKLTRTALRELRQAVRGYRDLDLAAELKSVQGVLEAAGIRCEVRLPYRDLPDGVAPVLAYAVREAVTNVLKHSMATYCEITLRFTDAMAELQVRNDGVARRQGADVGSGLTGMGERVAAVGGKMTALPTGDGAFVLTVAVSLPLRG